MDLVEIESAVGGASDGKMTVMYWIERAAKERDATRMVFGGGAVRLRGGQCASQEDVAGRIVAADNGRPNDVAIVNAKNKLLMNS